MCDDGYLLRHLLRKIKGQERTYSGSLVITRTDYIGSEDEVTKGCLVKGYFQDKDKCLSCKGLLPR